MAKLIITRGLPRSGKTTWAKGHVDTSGNFVRINRDDLRVMLHNNKWSPKNEEITIATQRAMVKAALLKGKSVIVDDTNLTEHHSSSWENLAKECGATFEIKKFDSSDIQLLIDRDNNDDWSSRRGEHTIVRMAMEHGYIYHADDSIVICDLDGTLCDIEHRRHFVKMECQYCGGDGRDGKDCITTAKEKAEGVTATHMKKDWNSFFAGGLEDKLRQEVFDRLLELSAQGKKIVFVSARPEKCRADTLTWFVRHGIMSKYDKFAWFEDKKLEYEALLMRPDGNSNDDTIIKQAILDKYFRKESIHLVIDDRPSVIRMWRSNGLTVEDVGDGVDF